LKETGWVLKMRIAGRVQRIGFAALVQRVATVAFALAFLACGGAMAADVVRQIPVIRDASSGLTVEISREGTRRTATPSLTVCDPTVQRIEERIGKKTARLAGKETHPAATAAGSPSGIGLTGTPREYSGRLETTLSSPPPVPGEITVRSVKGILKGLRASRKEKPSPAVVAVPEQRLGMAGTSTRETN
jgi:hypothetical protein